MQAIGSALGAALVAIVVALWKWHAAIAEAVGDSWRWLGHDATIPHWLLLLLIALMLGAALAALSAWFGGVEPLSLTVGEPPPLQEAEAFRDAYDLFMSEFAEWRDELVMREGEGHNSWLDAYRQHRRTALDALQPIRPALRAWLRRIDEHWTRSWPSEPNWHDIDGHDESLVSVIDKFLMPATLREALEFWEGWEPSQFRSLVAERVDLVDSFIRSLRRQPDPDDVLLGYVPAKRERIGRLFGRRQARR